MTWQVTINGTQGDDVEYGGDAHVESETRVAARLRELVAELIGSNNTITSASFIGNTTSADLLGDVPGAQVTAVAEGGAQPQAATAPERAREAEVAPPEPDLSPPAYPAGQEALPQQPVVAPLEGAPAPTNEPEPTPPAEEPVDESGTA